MKYFRETTEESKKRWEKNADFWDERMGDESNFFHRSIVRPHTEELLGVREGDLILDIACGTGNFSERLAEKGAQVVAFDYCEKLISHAKRRRKAYHNQISFHIIDATDFGELHSLKQKKPFDKAVANMAVMDIADISPLFKAVYDMLLPGGIFVYSTFHPCFSRPDKHYLTKYMYEGEAIRGQPVLQYYYHRSLQDIFHAAFQEGFIMDRFFEEPDDDKEFPVIIIVRMKKPMN